LGSPRGQAAELVNFIADRLMMGGRRVA